MAVTKNAMEGKRVQVKFSPDDEPEEVLLVPGEWTLVTINIDGATIYIREPIE